MLLSNVRAVHWLRDESKYRLLPNEAIERFLGRMLSRLGRGGRLDPRKVLRPFVSILNLLEQDTSRNWSALVDQVVAESGRSSDPAATELGNVNLG